jgi:type I restriction enzyme S subunit
VRAVALGDIVDFYSGGTPSKSNAEYWKGEVPWFSAKDLKKDRLYDSADHISESVFGETSIRRLPAGTIAMVVRGMILAHTVPISILEVPAAINQDLKALLPKGDVDSAYLAAMLRAQHATILSKVGTAAHGTKKLDSRVLESIEIPLPPLPEQRRIAAILDQADTLRSKRRQVLAHLDTLTKSILQALLAESFERVSLGELIEDGPKNGLYRPAADYGSGTPIVRIDSFKFGSGKIAMGSLKRLRASQNQVAEFALQPGDLLVNRVNSKEHVGKTAIVGELEEPTVFESNMMRIRTDSSRLVPVFAVEFMQTKDVRSQIAPMTKDAVNQSSINQTDVRGVQIPLPPLTRQREFATRTDYIADQRAAVQRALAADDELFASLQYRAFRGEL